MKRAARFAEYVPMAAIFLGFILIGLGWNGAASLDFVQGQVPYVISGGFAGLAFVFFGSAALVIKTINRAEARQEQHLKDLAETMHRLASTISFASTNGRATASNGDLVVVGLTSFHLPGCRIVSRREDLLKVPKEAAVADGLEPCRICQP